MTTPDLEHVLAETLHRRAEEAMIHTDTRTEYDRLEEHIADETPRHRRRLFVGALVAAAAAVAAGVWAAGAPTDRGSQPVQPSTEQTAAERVADEFVAAYAAGDVDLAASYVAPAALRQDIRAQMLHDEAWRMRYLREPCQEVSTSAAGTNVVCPFDYHLFRSDELGFGPFGNNNLALRISDGKVAYTDFNVNYLNNGEMELYNDIGAWVRANHPGDWKLMADTGKLSPAEMNRWYRLWDQRIDEYVADQLAGE